MTSPHLEQWTPGWIGFRRSETTVFLGTSQAVWSRVSADVLSWKVKTASGFSVDDADPVRPGARLVVTAHLLGLTVVEPVQVVSVVKDPLRVGFSYRTLPGHPVEGEEAFIVHRRGDEVFLTIRSLTRAAPQQPWKLLFPVLLVVQRIVKRRYLRALK